MPLKIKQQAHKWYWHTPVHSGIIHETQNTQATQGSVHGGMVRQNRVYPHNGL